MLREQCWASRGLADDFFFFFGDSFVPFDRGNTRAIFESKAKAVGARFIATIKNTGLSKITRNAIMSAEVYRIVPHALRELNRSLHLLCQRKKRERLRSRIIQAQSTAPNKRLSELVPIHYEDSNRVSVCSLLNGSQHILFIRCRLSCELTFVRLTERLSDAICCCRMPIRPDSGMTCTKSK